MCRTYEGEKGFDSSHSSFSTSTVGLRLAEKWLSEKIKLTMCHNEGLHARIMFCKKYFDKKPSGYYGKKKSKKVQWYAMHWCQMSNFIRVCFYP